MNPIETHVTDDEDIDSDDVSCPNCGLNHQEWSKAQGAKKGNMVYCCAPCANDKPCTCLDTPSEEIDE